MLLSGAVHALALAVAERGGANNYVLEQMTAIYNFQQKQLCAKTGLCLYMAVLGVAMLNVELMFRHITAQRSLQPVLGHQHW